MRAWGWTTCLNESYATHNTPPKTHSCPLSVLPPRDPSSPTPLTALRDRVLALFRLDALLEDDAWSVGMANP